LATAINKAPTVSIWAHAKKLWIAKSTCQNSLKKLGKLSLV
jgi:hypothetical protein